MFLELHYSLQYVERNGRNLSNPWSMRQVAICHRISLKRCFSGWIIIHPSNALQERLSTLRDENISRLDERESLEICAASSHLTIILNGLENWNSYLEYLSSEFKNRVGAVYDYLLKRWVSLWRFFANTSFASKYRATGLSLVRLPRLQAKMTTNSKLELRICNGYNGFDSICTLSEAICYKTLKLSKVFANLQMLCYLEMGIILAIVPPETKHMMNS
jgi:hypothetical protein